MRKIFTTIMVVTLAAFFAGCGGGSSGGGATPAPTPEGGGEATVRSLSTVPSMDLSTYDSSTSSSSNIAVPLASASLSGKDTMTEGRRDVGNPSRAGCESGMQKREMTRMSQQVQLSRCYPEAMESLGVIAIPDGSYNLYRLTPPEREGEGVNSVCEGIPEMDTERRAACEAGEDSGSIAGAEMQMRIGRFDNELRVDMCQAGSLMEEATYAASGSVYTVNAVHRGNFAGKSESSSFAMTIDLGSDGSVTNGVVDLGSAGTAKAVGNMDGGFGSGVMTFEKLGADESNRVYGAFTGSFTDPYTSVATSFTGRNSARFGGSTATGCAKFQFEGSPPPMRVADMLPFDIPEDEMNNFLRSFGSELGLQLTTSNYQNVMLCDNPNFDPASPSSTVKPMVQISEGETCPTVTHTGTECFSITNISRTGDFGSSVQQAYTIIANSGSPYYDEVAAQVISELSSTVTTPAFSRNWDCTGDFETLNFEQIMSDPAKQAAMETAMQACNALEEKLFAEGGMGEYNCNEQEQMVGVNKFAEEAPDFGAYGGEWGFRASEENSCPAPGQEGVPTEVGRLFVDNMSETQYCLPSPSTGACPSFTITDNVGKPDDVIAMGSWELVSINLASSPVIEVTYDTGIVECKQLYNKEESFAFTPGGDMGTVSGDAPINPGEEGFIPAPCLKADVTAVAPAVCDMICSDPTAHCRVNDGSELF